MSLIIKKVGDDVTDNFIDGLLCSDMLPIPRAQITLLYGEAGSGKSFLALKCAANLINNSERVLYISLEDNEKAFSNRCDIVSSFYNFDKGKILVSYSKPTASFFAELKNFLEQQPIELIIIDTFSVFFSEMYKNWYGHQEKPDENDNGAVNRFMNELKDICDQHHVAFLLLHHSNKDNSDVRGASSIKNSPRAVYKIITPTENTGFRHIEIDKENLGIRNSFIEQDIQILPITDFDKKNIQKSEIPIKTTLRQTELVKFNKGYISVNECRAILFLGIERITSSNIYKTFMDNDRSITFVQKLDNGYIETKIKNQILTQQHRTILDYVLRDFTFNLKTKDFEETNIQLCTTIEPYSFLKSMGKNPNSYNWLKEKLYELGNFMYDIKIVLNTETSETIVFERKNMQILRTDILELDSANSERVKKKIAIYLRPEYSNMLKEQSLLDYSDKLYLIDQISNPIIQDLIRFLFTVQSKNMVLSEFIKIRQYHKTASNATITKLKKNLLKESNSLREFFGIEVSPLGTADLLISFKRPKEVKFYSNKKDKYDYPTLEEKNLFEYDD